MSGLQPIAENVWIIAAPMRLMAFELGTRMTVVRLSSGNLLLHSAIGIDDTLAKELEALGPVAHIVCPNDFHHMSAGDAKARYPQALLHGPLSLTKKRPDLSLDVTLSETPHPDWEADLELHTIRGSTMYETVFYHPASKTLITSDLVENFKSCDHWPTRLWLMVGGMYGKIGWHRLLRFVYRDRASAQKSIDRILEWPFERVIIAHGDLLTENPHQAIREGMQWLKG